MTILRIAQVAPPAERVPPVAYGGTERVVYELVREFDRRGHEVTTFASGDSEVPGTLVATSPRALRTSAVQEDMFPWLMVTAREVLDRARRGEFDVIHMHLDSLGVLLAEASPVPVIATYHGRVDHPAAYRAMSGSRAHSVAISAHQASTQPDMDWAAVVHNGLSLGEAPFERRRSDALVFVGRVSPEKGILEAIEIAQRVGRPLRIVAKIGPTPDEQAYYQDIFRPALDAAGSDVEFIGELDGASRDQVMATCHATLMPGAWPEPFGLVAIESLACGTPVIARRVGALPEIVREGTDGFFGDDVAHLASLVERVETLDREAIRRDVIDRFSASRMTDGYETLMRSVIREAGGAGSKVTLTFVTSSTRTVQESLLALTLVQPVQVATV
jgi:glycosyltransferase involved in cell wall biosynthesis